MGTYIYAGIDLAGHHVDGRIAAVSEAVARYKLEDEQRIQITTLRPSFLSREFGSPTPNSGSVLLFTRLMASLLQSLTVKEALEIMRNDTGDARMERTLWEISVQVQSGRSLADAMGNQPQAFNNGYVTSIRAGEESNNLRTVMRLLTESIKRTQETRRKVMKGISYPGVIMLVGMIVTLIILFLVVPRFATEVAEAGADAPVIMQMMMGASTVLRTTAPILFPALAVLAWLGVRSYRTREQFRTAVDRLILRMPLLGTLITQAAIAGWARLFAILYTSRTPVAEAITVASRTVDNRVIRAKLVAVASGHAAGRPIHEEIRHGGLPKVMAKMIQVGEEGGRLAQMLTELAEYYEEETTYSVDKLTSKLEPLAIVIIMIPVGLLVGGVYMMMSQSMQAVAG